MRRAFFFVGCGWPVACCGSTDGQRIGSSMRQQLEALRVSVGKKLSNNARSPDQFFRDYARRHDEFVTKSDPTRFRESLLARIASYRLDNPKAKIEFSIIFFDHLQRIKEHYYQQKSKLIEANLKSVLALGTERERQLNEKQIAEAKSTLSELASRFGYDETSARECIKFLMMSKDPPSKESP
jgi:hypothetical protein